VHIITKGDVGGAQSHVADLATWQLAHGDDVTVIAGLDGPVSDRLRAAGVAVRVSPSLIRSANPLHDLRAVRALTSELAGLRPDVVHTHSSKGGFLGRIAARRGRTPAVYTVHGWPFQAAAPLAQRTLSRLGETVAGHLWGEVICLTQMELDLARRMRVVPELRLHLVPLGLPDGPVQFGDSGAIVRLVMVARFAAPKDHAGLLRVLAPLRDEHWHLDLIGDGPRRAECEQLARRLGIADRVAFLGSRTDVPAMLASADIACLVSSYEGMPLAVLEGLRAGIPVVASDLPGVRAILADSGAGFAVDGGAMTDALRTLIGDAELRHRMGAAGRGRYERELTIDRMAGGVAAVYAVAVERVRRRRP